MNPEEAQRDRQALKIFERAVEMTNAEARRGYLEGACGGDGRLKARVQALLAHHVDDDFLQQPAMALGTSGTVVLPIAQKSGDSIGRYKLLQQIGEGGCGVVYMAEQEEPVRRRVALKVIKLGMDTKSVIARFEAERQALALMDHPNIARVFDGGATETGRPYFVLELVRGVRITDFCDQQLLPTAQRLKLFIQVCHAIQHAHQKGIIHRDIKPSNILVSLHDNVPVPKVIDFGIAKAMGERLTDKTLFTAFEQFIGTPAYMSPEQAGRSDLDIDTRSDVYALGVLLYELLTGRPPFDPKQLAEAGLEAMMRCIREQEPVRPSTRLSKLEREDQTTTAQHRGTELPRLISLLQGDLDWIVMKCLEKDRTRRYETANGLAQDLERHLSNQPVLACPPSTAYRAQKFVRRNKVTVTAGAVVAGALVVGALISTWQAVRATRAGRRADEAARVANSQRARAEKEEQLAKANELAASQQAYAADINLAQRALGANDPGLAWNLLQRHRPVGKSGVDLRHWEWRYLWRLCQSDEVFTLCRETASISVVQASPDGKVLAVRRGDGQVALWDWEARRRLPDLPKSLLAGDSASNPLAAVMLKDIAFLPGGNLLAIGSTDARRRTSVVLWDASTGTERGRVSHRAPIASLAVSPDGGLLAIFDLDRRVTILDAQSKQERAYLGISTSGFFYRGAVQFSPDGERLAVGDNDGTIHVWQWRTGADMKIVPQPLPNGIMSLSWSPTDPLLAATGGYEGRSIRLWDPSTGKAVGELQGHTDWTGALAFSPDGLFIASASADRTVRVWRVADRTEFRCFRGHRGEVWTVVFLPDGKTLVSGDKEGTVRFWSLDATNPKPSHEMLPQKVFTPPDNVLAFAPGGRTFATACQDGRVRVWSTQPVRELEQLGSLGTNNYALDSSADGRWLAVADRAGSVRIWDWPARQVFTNLTMPPVLGGIFSFSPQGRFLCGGLVLTNFTRAGRIWETATWRELPPLPIDYSGVIAASVSPDEKLCATGYASGEVKLWGFPTGDPLAQPRAHAAGGVWVAFAPDGRMLASAAGDGFVQLWDVPERRPVVRFQSDRNTARGPAFSSDGRRLAVAGGNPQEAVKLWDMATFRELVALPAEGLYFMRTAFSPDGNTLVAIDSNGLTHLWHAPSFAEIEMVEREANGAAFAPEPGQPGRRFEPRDPEDTRPVNQTNR